MDLASETRLESTLRKILNSFSSPGSDCDHRSAASTGNLFHRCAVFPPISAENDPDCE
jgi:hypothetical protein